jgi:hypothetical protein
MPNNETSWTTVSGKTKPKAAAASGKSAAAPVIPKVEVKSIFYTLILIKYNI